MNPHIWYPFTQHLGLGRVEKIVRGEGLYLITDSGQRVYDAISSWWVNLFGHAHPKITEAIHDQCQTLEHVIFAGVTHEPAEQLAAKISMRLPEQLSRVFFSDNGSTANEVALKMSLQFFDNRKETQRTKILAFEGSYHGDTLGAMSMGARSLFSKPFAPYLFDVVHIPYPTQKNQHQTLEMLDHVLSSQGETFAAMIIEPLVQGVAGMQMCSPKVLDTICQKVDAYGILTIFDEVMTGFGRTGTCFALDQLSVCPDFVCLSKGLTGGFLPLALTVTTEKVFEGFLSDDKTKTFYHGHSYTANPLGCRAALATLDLLDSYQGVFEAMESWHQEFGQHLPHFRTKGTIAAFDLPGDVGGYLDPLGQKLGPKFFSQGLFLRPLGNVCYLMPPYCTTKNDLKTMYEIVSCVLKEHVP